MKEESWVEGTPGKAVPLNEKNGHWGVNYPTTLNAKDKTLMGLNRQDLQKLALSDDVREYCRVVFEIDFSEVNS